MAATERILEAIEADGSQRVRHAWFHNRWATLTFLHWDYDPAEVQRLLPPGLTADVIDGRAWVGVIPFRLEHVRPTGLPWLPWLSNFAETNVRTYVHDDQGRRGIHFFSLDAARLIYVLGARSVYRVPYVWSSMRIVRNGDVITYTSRRRWPGPRGAHCDIVVRAGEVIAEPDPLVAWLTARWSALSADRGGVRWTPVAHEPWTLRAGELLHLHDELVVAAGLPPPAGPALVHVAGTVRARIGRPSR
ncbi:MAG: hypothetical protein JWM05_2482 [Acidimicrobiales bacterium]|nr:hypothetical protein [Acidimicrobiales bacterium]